MARPRIVVADDHDKTRGAIASLLASDFDVVSTVADGQAAVEATGALYPDLVVLDISMPGFDADEVLNRLMVGNRPDAECFEDTIHPILDKAAGRRKRLVRIYGEMVDVLWSSGREEAALSLEILWHQLIAGRKCSLLCGYASGVCQDEGFKTICDRHSHVMPPHTAV